MYTCTYYSFIRNFLGIPGPDPGQVTIQIKTVASGVSDPAAQGFAFVIVPVLGSAPAN